MRFFGSSIAKSYLSPQAFPTLGYNKGSDEDVGFYATGDLAAIRDEEDFELLSTLSFWANFPIALGGKINRNGLIAQVRNGGAEVVALRKFSYDIV